MERFDLVEVLKRCTNQKKALTKAEWKYLKAFSLLCSKPYFNRFVASSGNTNAGLKVFASS